MLCYPKLEKNFKIILIYHRYRPGNKEGRALSPDIVCRDSEEPACRGSMLPGAVPDSVVVL